MTATMKALLAAMVISIARWIGIMKSGSWIYYHIWPCSSEAVAVACH